MTCFLKSCATATPMSARDVAARSSANRNLHDFILRNFVFRNFIGRYLAERFPTFATTGCCHNSVGEERLGMVLLPHFGVMVTAKLESVPFCGQNRRKKQDKVFT